MNTCIVEGNSQRNEDEIISKIFEKLKIDTGIYFEIGVNGKADKIECNTVKLLNKGWSGTWIDAKFKHPLVLNEYVTKKNINNLINSDLDFFSIDIDSYDFHIVKHFLETKTVDVKVFCVETNNYRCEKYRDAVMREDVIPPGPPIKNKNDAFGATSYSYDLLFTQHDYVLVDTSLEGINSFYVKKELSDIFEDAGNFDKLYKPSNIRNNWSRPGPDKNMITAKELLK